MQETQDLEHKCNQAGGEAVIRVNNNQEPKICKQCKYWSYEHSTSVCRHDMSKVLDKEVDKITGFVRKPIYRECVHMRFYSNCGEEGNFFEQREDLVYKVIKFFKKVKS